MVTHVKANPGRDRVEIYFEGKLQRMILIYGEWKSEEIENYGDQFSGKEDYEVYVNGQLFDIGCEPEVHMFNIWKLGHSAFRPNVTQTFKIEWMGKKEGGTEVEVCLGDSGKYLQLRVPKRDKEINIDLISVIANLLGTENE